MKVQIYGTGCSKCRQLAANVEAAAKAAHLGIELEKVTDINAIVAAGIMATPALAVDGKIVSTGRVLSVNEAGALLQPASSSCACGGGAAPDPATSSANPSGACRCGQRKGKRLLTVLLLLFVIGSVTVMAIREGKGKAEVRGTAPSAAAAPSSVPRKEGALTVFYFHGTMRCATCNAFERLTRQIVQSRFARQLADGSLAFQAVNIDLPENEHYVNEFQLTTKSVVLQKDGKSRNLDRIWSVIRESDAAFERYVGDEIGRMLEAE